MMDYYITTPSFLGTSEFWNFLSKYHIELLARHGIENFKQTIERINYWGEATPDSVLIRPLLKNPVTIEIKTSEIFKHYEFCSVSDSFNYNLANIMLLNHLVGGGYGKYIDLMEESLFGNPIFIEYNGKRISFALLNAILETDNMSRNLELHPGMRFLEIGAGSGRTCLSLFRLQPDSKYIVVDIPPALYISQENISKNLPEKKIFKFRNFSRLEEVREEFERADIVFLSPEQITQVPKKSVDVAIAIDCLHEMTMENIEKYFGHFDRIAHHLYFQCQNVQWAKTSKVLLTMDSYPIKKHWKKIVHEKCFVPNDYFYGIYQMDSAAS